MSVLTRSNFFAYDIIEAEEIEVNEGEHVDILSQTNTSIVFKLDSGNDLHVNGSFDQWFQETTTESNVVQDVAPLSDVPFGTAKDRLSEKSYKRNLLI